MHENNKRHFDAIINSFTGVGTNRKNTSGRFYMRPDLTWPELEAIYEQDGMGARIVDREVDDALRGGFSVHGANQEYIDSLARLKLDTHVSDASKWCRLYGGALLIHDVDDGLPFDEPMDLGRVSQIRCIHVVESKNAWPTFFTNKSESYTVNFGSHAGLVVHASRVVRYDGVELPPDRLRQRGGWGPSVFERVADDLKRLNEGLEYAHGILHDVSLRVYKLVGLREMLAKEGGRKDAQAVFEAIEEAISVLHILPIDSKDEYKEVMRTVTGVKELLQEFIASLVRKTNMGRTILCGEQPGGLNANSDTEIRAWYDFVEARREKWFAPRIRQTLAIHNVCRHNQGLSVFPLSIKFKPLWTPNAKESAEVEKSQIETAKLRIEAGISDPETEAKIWRLQGSSGQLVKADPVDKPALTEGPSPDAPGAAPVAEQALNGAQVAALVEVLAAVSRGELAPLSAEFVIKVSIPGVDMVEAKAAIAAAAEMASANVAIPTDPGGAPDPSGDDETELEEDPTDIAWSNDPKPDDLMSARDIASQLGVATVRVTKLAKSGEVRRWNILGKAMISLREVKAIVIAANQT